MKTKKNNRNLNKAKKAKNDEFYTKLSDIENELSHYKDHFRDKIIYCNCDDPYRSNFVQYFALNFKFLGLKQLIATCYKHPDIDDSQFEKVAEQPIKWVYNGEQIEGQNYPDLSKAIVTNLEGDGDFRSEDCLAILNECDMVVTNPPFSLFRDYIDVIMESKKEFLIIGSLGAICFKNTFPYILDGKMWLGYNKHGSGMEFITDNLDTKKVPVYWYTNLEHNKRNEELILFKKYNTEEYIKYDEYDAIEVSRVKEIPVNYTGKMGVPITFLNKYNPKQFEILGLCRYIEDNPNPGIRFSISGKQKYARIVIRNRKPQLD